MLVYDVEMEYPSPSAMPMTPEAMEQKQQYMECLETPRTELVPPPMQQSPNMYRGQIAILWDIENCPVPSNVNAEDVAGNILYALRVHPLILGTVSVFSAYGDFNFIPKKLREGYQSTGVRLIDIPNGRKDKADKAILVDMFLFALDNPPPSIIMLITGDIDFSQPLHILGQRGYTVILVIPSTTKVSPALCRAGSFLWDWESLARGEGFLPPTRVYASSTAKTCRGNPKDLSAAFLGCHINDKAELQNEEEAIVYRGSPPRYCDSQNFSRTSQSFLEYNRNYAATSVCPMTSRSMSLPQINEVSGKNLDDQDDLSWVRPGDLNGLKGQFVKLLLMNGGSLPFLHINAEYVKEYGRPLYISEYGAPKLLNLFEKMTDTMSVVGKGHHRRVVYIGNSRGGPPTLGQGKMERKGKEVLAKNIDMSGRIWSSNECSEEERAVTEQNDRAVNKLASQKATHSQTVDESIMKFKHVLQELLVSCSCQIFLGSFEHRYEQRYKRRLEYQSFGVNTLEELLEKVKDVAVLQEDPVSKRKYVVAVLG